MKATRVPLAGPPDAEATALALTRMAELFDIWRCFAYRGSYHFVLGDGWTISLAPESAGRFRIATCHRGVPRFRLWTAAADGDRLAAIALQLRADVDVRQEA